MSIVSKINLNIDLNEKVKLVQIIVQKSQWNDTFLNMILNLNNIGRRVLITDLGRSTKENWFHVLNCRISGSLEKIAERISSPDFDFDQIKH